MSSSNIKKDIVELLSSDSNKIIKVNLNIISLSNIISDLIENNSIGTPIKLNIKYNILKHIIDYCTKYYNNINGYNLNNNNFHYKYFEYKGNVLIIKIIAAANYLDIKNLIIYGCKHLAYLYEYIKVEKFFNEHTLDIITLNKDIIISLFSELNVKKIEKIYEYYQNISRIYPEEKLWFDIFVYKYPNLMKRINLCKELNYKNLSMIEFYKLCNEILSFDYTNNINNNINNNNINNNNINNINNNNINNINNNNLQLNNIIDDHRCINYNNLQLNNIIDNPRCINDHVYHNTNIKNHPNYHSNIREIFNILERTDINKDTGDIMRYNFNNIILIKAMLKHDNIIIDNKLFNELFEYINNSKILEILLDIPMLNKIILSKDNSSALYSHISKLDNSLEHFKILKSYGYKLEDEIRNYYNTYFK